MKVLITGVCGFVGSALAEALLDSIEGLSVTGIDNFLRPGSELNRQNLKKKGVRFIHGDLRMASDVACVAYRGLGDRRCRAPERAGRP